MSGKTKTANRNKLESVSDVKNELQVSSLNQLTAEQQKEFYKLVPQMDSKTLKDCLGEIPNLVAVVRDISKGFYEALCQLSKNAKEEHQIALNALVGSLNALNEELKTYTHWWQFNKRKKIIDEIGHIADKITEIENRIVEENKHFADKMAEVGKAAIGVVALAFATLVATKTDWSFSIKKK